MTAVEPYQPRAAEVAHIDPTGGRLVAWAGAATAAHQLATSLSRTSFVPKAFQGNAADATAAIMLGDELGLSPIAALRSIYIISGTPALYARTMVALAMSHGHELWTEESSDRQVTVCGRRRGQEHVERATWTVDRARKAGYTSNKKYDTDPQAMLYSKAAAEVARKIAPDVLSGVPYSVEDLELEEPPPSVPIKRASSRVQRQARPSPPEPEFEASAPVSSPDESSAPEAAEPLRSEAQSKAVHAGMTALNIRDREAGLAFISQIINREVPSTKELTCAEASRVIEYIKAEQEAIERGEASPEPTLDGDQ
jgi:hypothetical protein